MHHLAIIASAPSMPIRLEIVVELHAWIML